MNITAILFSIGGFLGGILSLKFIIINHIRVNGSLSTLLYTKVKNDPTFKFIMEEELVFDKKDPNIYKGLIKLNSVWILYDKAERLLTAGWQPKETLTDIYFFRWNTAKVKSLLTLVNKTEKIINLYAMTPYDNINIGMLDCNNYSISVDKYIYKDIEADVVRVLNREIFKTSALLYGKPGNGKTRFIRYIAQKYELPVYSFYCNTEYTNIDILRAFSNIPHRCIILFEDFDNYFTDRTCTMPCENIKFTFDILLNCLDGLYNDYKETVFFMTVNDISKVSDALKKRPSRFKYVREFTNPSTELKIELLGDKELGNNIGDVSLDQIFKIKDHIEHKGMIALEEAKILIN
jgi:hypothetical protein